MEEMVAWQILELAKKAIFGSPGWNHGNQDSSTVTSKCENAANGARVCTHMTWQSFFFFFFYWLHWAFNAAHRLSCPETYGILGPQ